MLIAIEGLDQSGKATQAHCCETSSARGGPALGWCRFPDYGTSIGEEIARALQGERDYSPEVMQLLYVANRFERKADLERWLDGGLVVVCDRYVASTVAYGEAQGLDADWLTRMQRLLPAPDLTILLDIAPELAVERKATGRDRYERDLSLLGRVRESYLRQAQHAGWVRVDGGRDKADVADQIRAILGERLSPA